MINMKNKEPRIPINIWDDYYEDGYVPKGKIQETYAYVEDYDISHELHEKYLNILFNYIQKNLTLNKVDIKLEFHDTKNDYDSKTVEKCIKEYGEKFFFKRWEIQFKNLTHKRLWKLVDELNEAKLSIDGISFDIYSES